MSERDELIVDAGYSGFCLGLDFMLQALDMDVMPEAFVEVLIAANDGRRHSSRKIGIHHKDGYDKFARHIARRAMNNLSANLAKEKEHRLGGKGWNN